MPHRSMNPGGGATARAISLKIPKPGGLRPTEVFE